MEKVVSETPTSSAGFTLALVTAAKRRPLHFVCTSRGNATSSPDRTAASRVPLQLLARGSLHVLAKVAAAVKKLCVEAPPQLMAPATEPPEAPAYFVVVVKMPRDFRIAVTPTKYMTYTTATGRNIWYMRAASAAWRVDSRS